MRDDGDFLKDLRAEIAAGQQRRANLVQVKLGALIGIFGLGSIKPNSVPAISLLHIVPLIIFVFDLVLIAEDFGIKRAGRFFIDSPKAPEEERRWEVTVRSNRDPVSSLANLFSSAIFLIVSAAYIWSDPSKNIVHFYEWLVSSCLLLLVSWIYGHVLVRRLRKLDKYLAEQEKTRRLSAANQE